MLKKYINFDKTFPFVLTLLILINIVFIFILFKGSRINIGKSNFSELQSINNKNISFSELDTFFKELAEDKGGRYAFNALKEAQLSPNIDLHLLGHSIGDVLYKQEGVDGISFCDSDFRNACSHSIVIGIFTDKGEGALPEIGEACHKAPGGSGAYTMCFHGLGHGILAFEGYDMEKASKICQRTGTAQYGYNETSQCISGMVMEIISGGFHDRDIWEKQRKKYLNKNNPLSLCQSIFIPNDSKYLCYDYLTPYLFEAVGADIGQPNAEDFDKAFKICDLIPKSNTSYRDACYGGFGKEFDGLVQGRDIRQGSINSLSNDKLKQIYDWCLLADNKAGINSCITHAMASLYWGGENDRGVSIRFCEGVEDDGFRKSCFSSLIGAVSQYVKDEKYRKSFCEEIPLGYREQCGRVLLY